jgi:hypothetical protein
VVARCGQKGKDGVPSGGDAVLVGPAAVELEFVGVDDPQRVEAALPLVFVAGAPGGGGVIVIAFVVGPAPFAVAAGGELDGEGELLLVVGALLVVGLVVVVAVGRWPPERWRGGLVVCRGGACRG